MNKDKA